MKILSERAFDRIVKQAIEDALERERNRQYIEERFRCIRSEIDNIEKQLYVLKSKIGHPHDEGSTTTCPPLE